MGGVQAASPLGVGGSWGASANNSFKPTTAAIGGLGRISPVSTFGQPALGTSPGTAGWGAQPTRPGFGVAAAPTMGGGFGAPPQAFGAQPQQQQQQQGFGGGFGNPAPAFGQPAAGMGMGGGFNPVQPQTAGFGAPTQNTFGAPQNSFGATTGFAPAATTGGFGGATFGQQQQQQQQGPLPVTGTTTLLYFSPFQPFKIQEKKDGKVVGESLLQHIA